MSKYVFFPELNLSINLDNIDEIKLDNYPEGSFLTFSRYNEAGTAMRVKQIKVESIEQGVSFMKILQGRTEGFAFQNEKPLDSIPEVMIIGGHRRDNRL
ncbi:MAG: hypothetical protein U0X91_20730 [Spirosomataceae bacterium]